MDNPHKADAFVETIRDIETRHKSALSASEREVDRLQAIHEATCIASFYDTLRTHRMPLAVCREMVRAYAMWRMTTDEEPSDPADEAETL